MASFPSDGGDSSICQGCNEPLSLSGTDWLEPCDLAYFVILCISTVAVLGCLALHRLYTRWRLARGRTNRFHAGIYCGALLTTLLSFVLSIVNEVLEEIGTIVTRSYHLLYVFITAAYLGSAILILIVLVTFVADVGTSPHPRRNYVSALAMVTALLTALAIVEIALYIKLTVYEINSTAYDDLVVNWSWYFTIIDTAFNALYLVALLGIAVVFGRNVRLYPRNNVYRSLMVLTIFLLTAEIAITLATDAIQLAVYAEVEHPSGLVISSEDFSLYVGPTLEDLLTACVLVLILPLPKLGARGTDREDALDSDDQLRLEVQQRGNGWTGASSYA